MDMKLAAKTYSGRRSPAAWAVFASLLVVWCGSAFGKDTQSEESEQANAVEASPGPTAAELTKLKQNPVSGLKQIGLDTTFYPNFPGSGDTTGTYSLQVVWPFSLNDDYRVISYTIMPIIHLPSTKGMSSETAMGNTLLNFFVSPKEAGAWVWGVGPAVVLPTRTDADLGSDRTALGPAAVLFYQQEAWNTGLVVQNVWSVDASGTNEVNTFAAQYIFNYNLPDSWTIYSNSTITSDWEEPSSERWTVPVGGGVSKLFYAGKVPMSLALQSFYNVVTPTNGPDWSVNLQYSIILGAPE